MKKFILKSYSNFFNYLDESIILAFINLIKTGFDWLSNEYFPLKISPYFDSDILHNENSFDSSTHGGNE